VLSLAVGWWLRASGVPETHYRQDLVAVAPWENRTGDPDLEVVGRLGSDWIIHGLQQSGVAAVVPAIIVEGLWLELDRGESSGDPVRFLARETGAAWVVHGAYYLMGDSIRFQVHLVDANSRSSAVGIDPSFSPRSHPLSAIGQLGERVLGALATTIQPLGWVGAGMMGTPPSLAVYRAWREGEESVERGDWSQALEHFSRAWSMDTTFLTPLVRSGWAHLILDRPSGLDSVLELTRRREQDLSHFELLQVAYLEAYRNGDLEGQTRAGRELALLSPTHWSFSAGLAALRTRRLEEGLRHFLALDPRVVPEPWYVAGQMYAARALHLRGEFVRELDVVRQAQRLYPGRLPLVEGEVRALLALGRTEDAQALVSDLVVVPDRYPFLPPAPIELSTSGSLLTYLALEARAHGQARAYNAWSQTAIEWHREVRAEGTEPDPMAFVRALYYGGRWEEALELLQPISHDDVRPMDRLGFEAVLAARLGKPERAKGLARELDALDTLAVSGANLLWRARVSALLGEKRRAVELLQEAEARGSPHTIWHHVELDFVSLAGFPPFQEFLAAGR
jgi:tetratricopeptide (TPR) repeat protein/TolB-like protein